MDPFAPFKLIAVSWAWWMERMGLKWLVILTVGATLVVAIYGCREAVALASYGGLGLILSGSLPSA